MNDVVGELVRKKLPQCKDFGKLIFFRGTVIRTSSVKTVENKRFFQCIKCQKVVPVVAERELFYQITKPAFCPTESCANSKFLSFENKLDDPREYRIDYQEIRVQEQISKLSIGTIPQSIMVILEEDLVDSCKPGDDVWITCTILT